VNYFSPKDGKIQELLEEKLDIFILISKTGNALYFLMTFAIQNI
jgi:hypothetical protein